MADARALGIGDLIDAILSAQVPRQGTRLLRRRLDAILRERPEIDRGAHSTQGRHRISERSIVQHAAGRSGKRFAGTAIVHPALKTSSIDDHVGGDDPRGPAGQRAPSSAKQRAGATKRRQHRGSLLTGHADINDANHALQPAAVLPRWRRHRARANQIQAIAELRQHLRQRKDRALVQGRRRARGQNEWLDVADHRQSEHAIVSASLEHNNARQIIDDKSTDLAVDQRPATLHKANATSTALHLDLDARRPTVGCAQDPRDANARHDVRLAAARKARTFSGGAAGSRTGNPNFNSLLDSAPVSPYIAGPFLDRVSSLDQPTLTDLTSAATRMHPRDEEHLRHVCALRPEIEAQLGGTSHAGELGATTEEARLQLLEQLVTWRTDLERQMNVSRERMLDVRVFAASLELFRFSEEHVAMHRRDPDIATSLFETLLYHLRGHAEGEEARFVTLAKRLRAVPAYFADARAVVTKPSAELVLRGGDVLDGAPDLLRAIVDASRQALVAGAISPAAAAEVQDAVQVSAAALDDQRRFLSSLDGKPHEPMGAAALDELLRLRGLDLTGAEVLDLARSVAEELRIEQARAAKRGQTRGAAPTNVEAAVLRARMGAMPQNLGEAMAWVTDLVAASRAFLASHASIPLPAVSQERVVVEAMPSVLAPSGRGILHMPPQPLAPRQESLLLVRGPLGPQKDALAELSVADLENAVAGLAYPGRHLQSVWTNLTTTLPRRGVPLGVFGSVAGTWGQDMAQGWAHASEELMRELPFRPSWASRLVMVRRTLLTTLLAAVDVCLCIGRMTPEQAAAFLVRRAGARLPVARAMVRTLLKTPTVGLSALVGKVRIEQLRREAHKHWREGYNDKRFHGLLLASGPLPLAYLFERLSDPPQFLSDESTVSFNDESAKGDGP